jgi:hypothetical protein
LKKEQEEKEDVERQEKRKRCMNRIFNLAHTFIFLLFVTFHLILAVSQRKVLLSNLL